MNGTSTGTVSISEQLTYDVMGNISTLARDGGNANQYHYNGNQLWYAAYVTNGYAYDANGNATTDGRKGIALSYNHLNLPVTAGKTGLSLVYTYDAMGSKVKKVSTTTATTTTDYVEGIQYTNGAIDFISTEEGRAVRNGTNFVYEYNLTDQLGNVRYVFNRHPTTGAVQPLQTSDYYPFGKRFGTGGVNNYLYNGKELQEGLDQYDYGARFYDAETGRWNVVDPLADHSLDLTPYHFCSNNPLNRIDPDGMCDKPNCPHKKGTNAGAGTITAPGIGTTIWNGVRQLARGAYAVGEVSITVGATAVALTVGLVLYPQDMGNNGYREPDRFTPPPPIPPNLIDNAVGKRKKNWLPDEGQPNTTATNGPGTSTKVYGPNGKVQKEHNKGHGGNAPKNEQDDHVHDHKPNPNPNDPGATERRPGRKPKPNEQEKDKAKQERRQNEANQN